MDIISTWAANRGLTITEDFVRNQLGLPNFQNLMEEKLDIINDKLNTLIEAPFKQALMYRKEGEIDKCKEKLIEAISTNELNLPATFLYTSILFEIGKLSLAIEYSEQIIKKFGPHKDLFSDKFLQVYSEALHSFKPFADVKEFNIQLPAGEIKAFAFSSSFLSFKNSYLRRNGASSYAFTYTDLSSIEVYDWNGNHIKSIVISDAEIYSMTNEYIILNVRERSFTKRKLKIFRLTDGKQIIPPYELTERTIDSLFKRDSSTYITSIDNGNSTINISFGQTKISGTDFNLKIT